MSAQGVSERYFEDKNVRDHLKEPKREPSFTGMGTSFIAGFLLGISLLTVLSYVKAPRQERVVSHAVDSLVQYSKKELDRQRVNLGNGKIARVVLVTDPWMENPGTCDPLAMEIARMAAKKLEYHYRSIGVPVTSLRFDDDISVAILVKR